MIKLEDKVLELQAEAASLRLLADDSKYSKTKEILNAAASKIDAAAAILWIEKDRLENDVWH